MQRNQLSRMMCWILLSMGLQYSFAENWPCWRGPRGDGTSLETNIPVQWDVNTNIVWKTPVPGIGWASPIVWENVVVTATALPETQERVLICFDRKTGACLWKETVVKGTFEKKHGDNSFASGTPATDGKFIYVSFLEGENAVVAAYDFAGKQVWIKRPGTFDSPHGYSCSPFVYKDKIIINGSSNGKAFVAALSCADGQTLWSFMLDKPALSYSTPFIREMAGRTQMIFCGNQSVAGYKPDDGAQYWVIDGPSQEFCSTPVYSEQTGLLYVCSSWPARHLLAVKPDGSDNVTETHIKWRTEDGAYYVPSPACMGDYLLTTATSGQVYCFNAADGKVLWKENLGKQYASPVLVNGLVYMPNDAGVITVIKPGPVFERIAQNSIGEKMFASPAISDGQIFLRGEKHLFCIGQASN
jgi:outer membrane protein assembly factor BamB